MRRYLPGHRIHTAVVVILSYFLASCGAGGPAGPDAPPIALSATSIVFSNENSQTITLPNLESEPIEWRVFGSSASWLTASPTTGVLEPRGNGSITVQVNRQAVTAGTHSAEMRIGAPRSPVSLNVSVQPASSARAALEPEALTIRSSEATGTLQLSNSGNSELDWTLSSPAWLTTSPASGRLAPGGNTRRLAGDLERRFGPLNGHGGGDRSQWFAARASRP